MGNVAPAVPTWRRACAFLFYLALSLVVCGCLVAWITGGLGALPDGGTGFQLEGTAALAVFAAMLLYFVIGGRYGFRIGRLLFGVRVRRPA